MANKTSEVSFAIRFRPSKETNNSEDDDDDDISAASNSLGSKSKKETVLFERQNVSSSVVSREGDDSHTVDVQASHSPPDTLWNSQTVVSKLIPGSETESPLVPSEGTCSSGEKLPAKAMGTKDNSKDATSTPTVEKSLFSGLKEKLDRLSAESKEIFDRKMRRSGSADAAKINALLTGGDMEKMQVGDGFKSTESRHTRSPSDSSSIFNEPSSGSATPVDQCSNGLTSGPSLMHKSASVGASQLSKAEELALLDSIAKNKRLSVATEHELVTFRSTEKTSLSDLRTSCNDSEQQDSVTENATIKPLTHSVADVEKITESFLAPSTVSSKFSKFYYYFQNWQKLMAFIVVLVAYILTPLPEYLSGFVTGSLCALILFIVYLNLTKSKKSIDIPVRHTSSLPVVSPKLKEASKSKQTEAKFQGWMNELNRYDVSEYHISQTSSVFITLEGTTLRLQTPKHGIAKRAIIDESIPPVTFVRQRHFDLSGGRVYLLPSDLVSKRLWSKKYPICIEPGNFSKNRGLDICGRDQDSNKSKVTEWNDAYSKRNCDAEDSCERQRNQLVLYLFARTCREKEEWYRRFVAAARGTPWPTRINDVTVASRSTSPERRSFTSFKHRRTASTDSTGSGNSVEITNSPVAEVDYGLLNPEQNLAEYVKYMKTVMSTDCATTPDGDNDNSSQSDVSEPNLTWLNALIGRCFLDFLREKYWAEKMREKIQKKLCKMHVPHFIDQLSVTGIELGSSVPSVCRVHPPFLDDRGLWVDLDITYSGGFCISMATKCNLMKLKQSASSSNDRQDLSTKEKRSAVTHSDEEDSAESTTDDENVEDNSAFDPTEDKRPEPMGKKLLRFVDKISQSRYFQQATEYKYIKKAMEEVSNTLLVLNVELCSINGTLSVNIPPPPTDRIWYGFRGNPNLVLSAKPYVGEREVNLSPVTDWIEKKLAVEFQRVFVMPNMDDIPITLMRPHLM